MELKDVDLKELEKRYKRERDGKIKSACITFFYRKKATVIGTLKRFATHPKAKSLFGIVDSKQKGLGDFVIKREREEA